MIIRMFVVEECAGENYDVTSILREDTINLSSIMLVSDQFLAPETFNLGEYGTQHPFDMLGSFQLLWKLYQRQKKKNANQLFNLHRFSVTLFTFKAFAVITKCYQTITIVGLKFSALETCHF